MKKYIMLLLVMGITLFMPISAKAEIVFQQSDDDIATLNSIKEDGERIISTANAMLGSNYELSDINFDDAIKFYMNIDLFKNKHMSQEILEQSISNAESIWILPIYDDGEMITLTITKGEPVRDEAREELDEEEIKKLEDNVGKWTVPEVAVEKIDKSYKQLIKETLENNSVNDGTVYVLGGTIKHHSPLAINFTENRGCEIIPLRDMIEKYSYSASSTEQNVEKVIFSFEEMRKLVKNNDPGSMGVILKEDKSEYIIILIIIMFISTLGSILYTKIKKIKLGK